MSFTLEIFGQNNFLFSRKIQIKFDNVSINNLFFLNKALNARILYVFRINFFRNSEISYLNVKIFYFNNFISFRNDGDKNIEKNDEE